METEFLSKIEVSTILCLPQTTKKALALFLEDKGICEMGLLNSFDNICEPTIVKEVSKDALLAYLEYTLLVSEKCEILQVQFPALANNLNFQILRYATGALVKLQELKSKLVFSYLKNMSYN